MIAPPGGMVVPVLPLKYRILSVVVSIAPPPAESATWTEANVTGLVLNSFEKRMRRVSPPRETRTICRSVLLLRPGDGGLLPGSTSCGAVLQVPTHLFAGSDLLDGSA